MSSAGVGTSPYHRAMSRRLVSPTLVGRATELAAMARALDGPWPGSPSTSSSPARPASASRAWCRAASAAAATRGMRVLMGGCADVGDGGVPYGPIVEALRDSRPGRSIRPSSRRSSGSARTDSRPSRPVARSGRGRGPATQTRVAPGAAARRDPRALLQRLAEIAPVVFVVEDLHWADPATRETIAFLIRHLRTDRVVLLMTFRADELHRRHPLLPWLAELERSGRVERIDLRRLDPARDRQLLLAAILGTPPTERSRRPDPSALGRQPVLRRGAARGGRGRRPAVACRRRCGRSCWRASWPCPSAPRPSSASRPSPGGGSTTTSSRRWRRWTSATCSTGFGRPSAARSS